MVKSASHVERASEQVRSDYLGDIRDVLRSISPESEWLYDEILKSSCLVIDSATPSSSLTATAELEKYGFVFRRTTPAGYELLPTPFEILVPSLLHRVQWKYPPFTDISDQERMRLENVFMRLRENLPKSVAVPNESPASSRTLEGTTEIDSFLAHVFRETQEVCAISAAEWSSNLPLVWAVIEQRMRQGMHYRRIVSPLGLAAFGWQINSRDTSETGIELRVDTTPALSPFYLFTGELFRSALVFVPPANDASARRATYTALGQLADRLFGIFEDRWKTAVPAPTILRRLDSFRPVYIGSARKAFGERGVHIAELLFNKGIFSELTADEAAILPSLVDAGLLVRSKYTIGRTNHVPNITEEIARYVREERVNDEQRNI